MLSLQDISHTHQHTDLTHHGQTLSFRVAHTFRRSTVSPSLLLRAVGAAGAESALRWREARPVKGVQVPFAAVLGFRQAGQCSLFLKDWPLR